MQDAGAATSRLQTGMLEFDIRGLFDNINHELLLEPVRKLNESLESFVNQGRRPDLFGGRRCGRVRIAGVTSGAGCAIRATCPTRNGRWSSRSFRRPGAAATGGR